MMILPYIYCIFSYTIKLKNIKLLQTILIATLKVNTFMQFIIVLGNSKPDVRRERVKRAIEYYDNQCKLATKNNYYGDAQSFQCKIIFSGKGRSVEGSSEAEDMLKIALELGVPSDICSIENKSNNTIENFTETLKLLFDAGWFKPTIKCGEYTFIVCTSFFHAARSLVTAKNILSPHGTVKIIHTREVVPPELENRENQILVHYVRNFMLPQDTILTS